MAQAQLNAVTYGSALTSFGCLDVGLPVLQQSTLICSGPNIINTPATLAPDPLSYLGTAEPPHSNADTYEIACDRGSISGAMWQCGPMWDIPPLVIDYVCPLMHTYDMAPEPSNNTTYPYTTLEQGDDGSAEVLDFDYVWAADNLHAKARRTVRLRKAADPQYALTAIPDDQADHAFVPIPFVSGSAWSAQGALIADVQLAPKYEEWGNTTGLTVIVLLCGALAAAPLWPEITVSAGIVGAALGLGMSAPAPQSST